MAQLEQLQRATLSPSKYATYPGVWSAKDRLLGIHPLKQEWDIRKLTLLGSILVYRDPLVVEFFVYCYTHFGSL